MERHALQYSKGYKAKKGYTFWEKDFDAMAYKTMLRQLISKWGIMSIEMQEAFTKDQSAFDEEGEVIIQQEEPPELAEPVVGAMTEDEAEHSEPMSLDDI